MSKPVGARELKTRLGQYLRAVRAGATVIVTERGEPVAELRPITRAAGAIGARLEMLAASGLVTKGSGGRLRPFAPIASRGRAISETIAEQRDERI